MKLQLTKAEPAPFLLSDLRPGQYAKVTQGPFTDYIVLAMEDRAALLSTGGYLELTGSENRQCTLLSKGDVLTLTF